MTMLSERLLSGLPDDSSLDDGLSQCYRWIWYVILHNQPADILQQQLSEIEVAAPNTTPQCQLELAWKSAVIEDLLGK